MLVPNGDNQYRPGITSKCIPTQVDITEASAANLTPNTVFVTDAKILEMQKSVTTSNLQTHEADESLSCVLFAFCGARAWKHCLSRAVSPKTATL